MYVREIANDFVASAWTRITSADRGVKWYGHDFMGRISGGPPKTIDI